MHQVYTISVTVSPNRPGRGRRHIVLSDGSLLADQRAAATESVQKAKRALRDAKAGLRAAQSNVTACRAEWEAARAKRVEVEARYVASQQRV